MGLFGFLKKKPKAEAEIELPPPPRPPEAAPAMPAEEEIPPIRPGMPEMAPPAAPEEIPAMAPEMPPMEVAPMPEEMPRPEDYEMPPMAPPAEAPPITPAKVFDKTVREFFPAREEVIRPKEIKPMFVAVDEYKNLAGNTKVIRAKLLEAEDYVAKLSDLKNQKEKIFEKWRKLLEDTEKKLSYVDAVIEKAQG